MNKEIKKANEERIEELIELRKNIKANKKGNRSR